MGKLEHKSTRASKQYDQVSSVADLLATAKQRNEALITSLKHEEHSDALLKDIAEDVSKGRMSKPRKITEVIGKQMILTRRFAVVQGENDNGTPKIRSVDDATESGLNACFEPTVKLTCDNVDTLAALCKTRAQKEKGDPMPWKADVKSAYRIIPVKPAHRRFLPIAFRVGGEIIVAAQYAMPFGSVASVHAWDRIGELIWHLGTSLLKLPLCRYVDDFFSVGRTDTVENAKECFRTLVDTLFGDGSISVNKLLSGNPLVILGLQVAITPQSMTVSVDRNKADKWIVDLREALESGKLHPSMAGKLAGRLCFATCGIFRKVGRAMIRPFYARQHAPATHVKMTPHLKRAAAWWIHVLQENVCEQIDFKEDRPTLDLLTDAASSPACVAAVLISEKYIKYTCKLLGEHDMATLLKR